MEKRQNRSINNLFSNAHVYLLHWFVGNVINIQTGEWVGQMSGLGAGADSFYEYLLKVSENWGDLLLLSNI